MKFYDVGLKNYVVLFARQGRGLNHSGGNSEGRPILGEGGYSVFQVMGMIEWDRRALLTTNLQIVLNTQTKTNPYLSQATQKNTCQIFLPKKLPHTTISNPPKFFEHPLHLKFGVPLPPPPGLKVAMKHTCPSHGLRTFCGKLVRLQITSLEREKH